MENANKKNCVGYLQGSFDLFHRGHLRIIEKSKDYCDYLIVGVVTDELSRFYKGEYPFIPLDERMEIVRALRGVDQVVAVDFKTADKAVACQKWHFDLHLAGSDHEDQMGWLQDQLATYGAKCQILPYTESTSSTKIKNILREREAFYNKREEETGKEVRLIDVEDKDRWMKNFIQAVMNSYLDEENIKKDILIMGAGKRGRKLLGRLKDAGYQVKAFLDNSKELHGRKIENISCHPVNYYQGSKDKYLLINSLYDNTLVQVQLESIYNGRCMDQAAIPYLLAKLL